MSALIWVDHVLLGLLAVSTLVSLFRGFMREAISLAGWIAAAWLSLNFSTIAADYLVPHVSVPSLRLWLAFLGIFMGTLLLTGVIGAVAGMLVEKTGLTGTDRVLGMIFGAARGVVIGVLLVAAAGLTPLPRDPWWQASVLLPHFERFAVQIRSALPPEVAEYLRFV